MDKLDCGITDLFRSITTCEIGCKCDSSISLYADKDSQTPECTHSFSSQSRHNVLKLVALVGLITVGITMFCVVCSCICGIFKKK